MPGSGGGVAPPDHEMAGGTGAPPGHGGPLGVTAPPDHGTSPGAVVPPDHGAPGGAGGPPRTAVAAGHGGVPAPAGWFGRPPCGCLYGAPAGARGGRGGSQITTPGGTAASIAAMIVGST